MPNLISSPRKWRKKAFLLKAETTYGTDSTPTGAANYCELREIDYMPLDVVRVARNLERPYMGNTEELVESCWAKISGFVGLAPSGTAGTAPAFGPALKACGFSETVSAGVSVVYNLISTGFTSACAWMNVDTVKQVMTGMRGNAKFSLVKGQVPKIDFSFEALFNDLAAGVAVPAVTTTAWKTEEAVNSVNTGPLSINGVDTAFTSFEVDIAQKLNRRDLPGPQLEITIGDRAPSSTATILAPALGTLDPVALVKAGTVIAVSVTHGSAAGKKCKIDLNAKIIDAKQTSIDGDMGWNLSFQPVPVSGDDEVVVTFL